VSRRLWFIVACVFFVAAAGALVLWLGSRSDTTLARWSSIATIFSAAVTVLALVAAVIPLWRHDDGSGTEARRDAPETGTVVHQKISGKNVNAAGRDQFNINLRERDNER
jgi:hypothetical protein